MSEIDATNKFMVCKQGERVAIIKHPYAMNKADALNLAAWLVSIADTNDEFKMMLEKVQALRNLLGNLSPYGIGSKGIHDDLKIRIENSQQFVDSH